MKALWAGSGLGLALLSLSACAPQLQSQSVEVWEGTGRVLLREQSYRLTFSADPRTHQLAGTLENRSSGDRFQASGTLLPVAEGAELTAQITAGSGARLSASVLGFGVSGVALKSDALLTGRVAGAVFKGSLRVNGVAYPLELRRVR
ncbi:hypothetical protein [Deinococcus sp. PESE-13]